MQLHDVLRADRIKLLAAIECEIAWLMYREILDLYGIEGSDHYEFFYDNLPRYLQRFEESEPMLHTDIIELAAKTAHTMNNIYREALGEAVKPAWDDCPDELRRSVRAGVFGIASGLSPEDSHAGWMKFKTEHGWTYGEVEDAEKKTHPCLVHYDELPPAQRLKDTIFHAVVRGVLMQHGLID